MSTKILYAPWRSSYTQKTTASKRPTKKQCPFCQQLALKADAKYFIIRRFKYTAILLNLYPYNAGHLLIIPLRHLANIHQLSVAEQQEMIYLIGQSSRLLQHTLECQGCNMGTNEGAVAGGSITTHLHIHLVPRWEGDTNFMPIVGHAKCVSFDLKKIYFKLKTPFDALELPRF
jgi:ATP adenylyltransferase